MFILTVTTLGDKHNDLIAARFHGRSIDRLKKIPRWKDLFHPQREKLLNFFGSAETDIDYFSNRFLSSDFSKKFFFETTDRPRRFSNFFLAPPAISPPARASAFSFPTPFESSVR